MGLWLALIVCIALSALFSATETAFSASNKVKLKTVEGSRKERAQIAIDLLDKYDSLLTTVLIGNNIVNIAGTAIATLLFTTRILPGREDLATTVASAVMTVLVLFLGEVGPKTLAKQQPERFAMSVSPLMRTLVVLLHPLDLLFSLYRRLLSRIVKPDPEENQIENELMTMIDEAQTEGDIEEDEGELIRSAIEFSDQNAEDIMTPRVDVTAIEDTATLEEAADLFRATWYSRIPVYHEDLDHIVGTLNEKDFYKMTHEGVSSITEIMKEPVFAPASLSISNLMKLFRTSKTHQVILLDEYGGTEGIVTMEDVLEELVGEIYDEHDEVEEEVVEQEDGTVIVDGGMQLEEMLEKYELPNNYETDTVGGWVSEMLEKVPELNDSFDVGGWRFQVTEMDGFRVTRVQISKAPEEEPAAAEADGEQTPEAGKQASEDETKE
ncbi:MAG: HlyC/CorC family transporter [Clostridia bacterium]|nr:HlyC/CorC family transporter [Clostridia bacterium]MBQ6720743.1 HlyC/CorC family transporter [Clostridia bacterium]